MRGGGRRGGCSTADLHIMPGHCFAACRFHHLSAMETRSVDFKGGGGAVIAAEYNRAVALFIKHSNSKPPPSMVHGRTVKEARLGIENCRYTGSNERCHTFQWF